MMPKTIFIAGVHGVGKTTMCQQVIDANHIHLSASSIIKSESQSWSESKIVKSIEGNQNLLKLGLEKERNKNPKKNIIIDGHFTLLTEGGFSPISYDVFDEINIDAVILIFDDPKKIKKRLESRDKSRIDYSIKKFSEEELSRAKAYCKKRSIPFFIIASGDVNSLKTAIVTTTGRVK